MVPSPHASQNPEAPTFLEGVQTILSRLHPTCTSRSPPYFLPTATTLHLFAFCLDCYKHFPAGLPTYVLPGSDLPEVARIMGLKSTSDQTFSCVNFHQCFFILGRVESEFIVHDSWPSEIYPLPTSQSHCSLPASHLCTESYKLTSNFLSVLFHFICVSMQASPSA